MWPKIFEVKETGTPPTFDLIDDVAHKRLMVYRCQNHDAWEMVKGDYEINGNSITITSPIVKAKDKIWVHDFYRNQIEKLESAEVLFKMAFAMHSPNPPERFQYLGTFSYGGLVADKNELILSSEEEERATVLLQHVATYLLANQISTCLQRSNTNMGDAYIISYLIRNTFAHDPFMPQWKIKNNNDKNKVFNVSGIIKLDTSNLHGKGVVWHDFGGPIALLRLSEYVRQNIQQRSEKKKVL